MGLSFPEFLGYLASILVLVTFYMRTMIALRCVAVASNVAFILYAYLEGLVPILILHGLLLPTNLYRLAQIRRLVKRTSRCREQGFPLQELIPFMAERTVRPGEILFRRGDRPTGMYFLAEGRIRIPEAGVSLGPGEILGEISLFTPGRRRTTTAVSEQESRVYWLPEATVMQTFHQNPRFGFSLTRAIAGKLIDNVRRLNGDRSMAPDGEVERSAPSPQPPSEAEVMLRKADRTRRRTARRRRAVRAAMVLMPLFLVGATLHDRQTYLASLIFRDAVVTGWLHTATSPIAGQVDGPVPKPGVVAGGGQVVLSVRNRQADDTELLRLSAEIDRAEERVEQLEAKLAELRATSEDWNGRAAAYARVFRDSIAAELSGLRRELEFAERRLGLSEKMASRVARLARIGVAAVSSADETRAGIMALHREKSRIETRLNHARYRSEAARDGIFITPDGSNPDWALGSRDLLELRIIETADALAEAQSNLAKLREEHRAVEQHYARTSRATITLPHGSIIRSVPVAPGATVARGTPLLRWTGCERLLVDVPVAGASLGLFAPGTSAKVHVDGLDKPLRAHVVQSRGAAARLGATDLATRSKAGEGSAQLILALDTSGIESQDCLIGRSAYAQFPEIGFLERVGAFLRL